MSCLLIIDIQNDFVNPKGSLYVPDSEKIINNINNYILEKRKTSEIIYTKDNHLKINSHFKQHGGEWPIHCMENTWGNMFYPGLLIRSEDKIVKKGMYGDGYSAFSEVCLDSGKKIESSFANYLHAQKITDITIIGIAFDYCVLYNALDAKERGFNVLVVKSLTKSVNNNNDSINTQLLKKYGIEYIE